MIRRNEAYIRIARRHRTLWKSALAILVVLMSIVQAGLILPERASATGITLPGAGTESNPYLVASGADMDQVRIEKDKYYKMTDNIDLSAFSNWLPIGTQSQPFIGKFDGNGHAISGLIISGGSTFVGLFGYVGAGGELTNFTIQDGSVSGATGDNVGIAVGGLAGTVNNVHIVGGSVSVAMNGVGGLAGLSDSGSTIANSSASAAVQTIGGFVGGLVGKSKGSIRDSRTTGNTVIGRGGSGVGGLVGFAEGGSIEGSYSSMNVQQSMPSNFVGGLVGVGINSTISNSFATGNVSAPSSVYVGGLAGGLNLGTITNSYAKGAVTGAPSMSGGLVGFVSGASESGAYFDQNTTGQLSSLLGTPQTTVQMGKESTFDGWNFDTEWVLDDNAGYPELMEFDRNAPQVKSAIVFDGAPSHLIVTFKERVRSNDATVSKFSANVDGAPLGITSGSLGVDKRTIDFVLGSPVQAGQDLTFSYLPTGDADDLMDLAGNKSNAISDYAVDNQLAAEIVNAEIPTIHAQPLGRTVNRGGHADLSVTASVYDDGVLSYAWYSNSFNSTIGATATGATGATYSAPTTELGTTYYFVEITNTDTGVTGIQTASVTSDIVAVTVNDLTNASTPAIGLQPANQSVYVGESASLSVTASVYGEGASLSYQWYGNGTNSNSGGTLIGRATGSTFTPPTTSVGTTYYYVVVTNADSTATGVQTASATSNAAQVIVTARPSNTTTPTSIDSTEEIAVDIVNGSGSEDTLVSKAVIKRTKNPDGSKKDEVVFAAEQASQTVERLAASGSKLAQLVIPDAKDEVSELNVKLPATSTGQLAKAGIGLEIYTDNVRIQLPSSSMEELTDDSYFRVVPIKAAAEREQLEKRAIEEQAARFALSVNGMEVIGRPMTIETNLQSRPVTLVLPLGVNDLTEEQRKDLGIYIEHSDGTKAFVRGEIIAYDNTGKLGVRFSVDHFSTFAVVHMDGWSDDGKHAAFINGYATGTFGPDRKVTRAEIAAMLVRAFDGGKASGDSKVYSDVPSGYWAKESIDQATAMGLMDGYPDGSFKPEQTISRAEMANIAARLLSLSLSVAGESFSDIGGHWAKVDMEKAQAAGILNGYTDGTFRPENSLTRAEAVKIVVRLLGREPVAGLTAKWKDVPEQHWAYGYIQEASVDHEANLHTE